MQYGWDILIKKYSPKLTLWATKNGFLGKLSILDSQFSINGDAFSNVRTTKKTIGVLANADTDFAFVTADNKSEQVIDLGAIVPALARVLDVKTHTKVAFDSTTVHTTKGSLDTNVATLTTSADHGITNGDTVVIAGMTNTVYNGSFTATRTGARTFTVPIVNGNIPEAADTGGTVKPTLPTMVAETGTSSSGNQYITSATILAKDAITAAAAGAALAIAPSASAVHVYVAATPGLKFSAVSVGQLDVYVSYITIN